MRITFLGTAASEGFPNAFCHCENCEGARALGGPSLRKRSSALINSDLLIDIGPDCAERGGEVIYSGSPLQIIECERSETAKSLRQQ